MGILFAVCLHEAGHMLTAKWFGMRVTKYFAGFGPTIWSFKRGETEYGVKAMPFGGFVKIVGMTPAGRDRRRARRDDPRAMWRFPVWKRTIVMTAGSITHFVIAPDRCGCVLALRGHPRPRQDDERRPVGPTPVQPARPGNDAQTKAPKACDRHGPGEPGGQGSG